MKIQPPDEAAEIGAEPTMTGIATLGIENRRLVWGQSTRGVATLQNTGSDELNYLNSSNWESTPTFILKDLQSGATEVFSKEPPPGLMASSDNIEIGDTWSRPFDLASMIDFPKSGAFDISVRFDWSGGKAISDPVTVEIVPSLPEIVTIETATGGPYGDVYCVWTNREGSGTGLWMWRIGTNFESKIKESIRLGDVPTSTRPVLSVPPNSASRSKYVAWIEGASLKYVAAVPAVGPLATIQLDAADYVIVRPVLESPYGSSSKTLANVLLARSDGLDWELLLIAPNDLDQQRKVRFKGPPPVGLYTAYRSDRSRRTVIWQDVAVGSNAPFVRLGCLHWSEGSVLAEPITLAECAGKLVAFDQALLEDDSLSLSAILYLESEKKYQLLTWRLDSKDAIRFVPGETFESNYSKIFLRQCPDGTVYALFKNANDGRWRTFESGRGFGLLPESLQGMPEPMAMFFVDRAIPAIILNDAQCGLRIMFPGPKPRRITLAGA